jgi:hypothetical protein
MNLTFINQLNRLGVNIDTEHIDTTARQHGSRWQANISKSHDNDFLKAGCQKCSPNKGLPVITLVSG